ncbi:hypothetical protein Smp_197440 [Schistosoma mansoni]|uniref:hypothetical protein n=1 Tax=Schistosoma mansoni TaxID=6183 RepID=UPI00022DC631|nr:hypothetical protein Smp_197440 [Schistosoma mansoni]|eukprot:XP_018651467.1 hypothetical protein Smp_197440 [Schistosoma mansoni]
MYSVYGSHILPKVSIILHHRSTLEPPPICVFILYSIMKILCVMSIHVLCMWYLVF